MPEKKKERKPGSGGFRTGAGSKPKYAEPTKSIAFRVPVSKVDEVKKIVNKKLKDWKVKKEKTKP